MNEFSWLFMDFYRHYYRHRIQFSHFYNTACYFIYNEYSFPFLYPLTDVCWIHNIVNRKFWLMTAIKICEIKQFFAINCLSDSVCEKWGDQMIILKNSITGLLWLHSIWKAWHQTSVFVFQIKIKFLTKFHFFSQQEPIARLSD